MIMTTPKTLILWDPRYLLHDMGHGHPESPARLEVIGRVLEEPEIRTRVQIIAPRAATLEEISLLHDADYVRQVETTEGHEVPLDPDTTACPHSWEAARLAVGGVLECVDRICASESAIEERSAFAFVRPPGHHAERARAMGFCLFNNAALGAEYALKRHGLKRVLIMDYDVHHGNGTQHAFYDRSDVFYISTHRYPFYPGTGARREEGAGEGRGYTRNIPFSGGEGDHEYLMAFDREVLPVAEDFAPELVIVSAGYDAHELDPLGGMNVTAEGFARMTEGLRRVARKTAGGRILLVLEGGYSLKGLADSVRASLMALTT